MIETVNICVVGRGCVDVRMRGRGGDSVWDANAQNSLSAPLTTLSCQTTNVEYVDFKCLGGARATDQRAH